MANNTDSLGVQENLAELQQNSFDIFGYTNFREVRTSGGLKFHEIYADESPIGITTYDSAPVGSRLYSSAGGNDLTMFIKEASGATGWAAVTTGAQG